MKWNNVSSFHKKRYAEWAGNPQGIQPDSQKCCGEVHKEWKNFQCSRPRGYGPEEAYCKIHDPASVEAKQKAADLRYEESVRKMKVKSAGPELLAVVQRIAEGHNDAMVLAQEILTKLDLW